MLVQKPYGLGEKAVCKSSNPCSDAPVKSTVRKSRIQLNREVLRLRLLSLGTSLAGTIVLNTEL